MGTIDGIIEPIYFLITSIGFLPDCFIKVGLVVTPSISPDSQCLLMTFTSEVSKNIFIVEQFNKKY